MTNCGRREYICCVISADRSAHGRDFVLSAARHRRAHIPPCATGRGVAALAIAVAGRVAALAALAALAAPAVPGARIHPVVADAQALVAAGVGVVTTGQMVTTMTHPRLSPTDEITALPSATIRSISSLLWLHLAKRWSR